MSSAWICATPTSTPTCRVPKGGLGPLPTYWHALLVASVPVANFWAFVAIWRNPARIGFGLDVMNGIAYDAESDRLFVTGKNWTRLFEISLKLQE